jgi:hypothetical protein
MPNSESINIEINEDVFQISIDGAMASQDISEKISSIESGDWKKITSMEYNIITGQIRITYQL